MDMAKPKIRFNGYTEDWEQRKVGELLEERNEQAPMSEDYPLMAFIANQGVAPKGERYDRSALVNDETGKKYKRTEFGDFIYSSNNLETGSIGLNKYGNACISPVYSIFKPTGKAELDFLGRRFLRKDFINEMVRWRQGVVYGQWKIHETDFMKIEVRIPSVDEQKKIGQYFDSLDNLITLHQRKCEQTKTLKKYMLQKMFPQDGEKVPQIRFEGFTEDWEQRKLNEIADKVSEKNKNNEFSEPFTNSAEQGIISQKDYFDREIVNNENLNGYYIVRNDDFIYNPRISVTAPVGPINRNRLGRNGVMSPLYTVFRTHDIDNLYLEFYFKTTKWHRFMKLNGDSGARFDRFTISSTQFMEMPIPYPTLEEQQKIGEYFESLDHLITLHLRKQDKRKKGSKNT